MVNLDLSCLYLFVCPVFIKEEGKCHLSIMGRPGNIWCHYGLYSKRKTWCFTFLLLKSKHECSKSGELHICTCLLKNPVGVWEYMQPLSIGRRESPITIKREHSASFDGCPICTRSKVLFFTFAKALG